MRVVRVAVALRRRVAVVEVGQERPVRRAEVLAVEVQRVLVEVVLEPDEAGLPYSALMRGPGKVPLKP